ncbi:Subunit of the glycosylphosphatidylinositol transamidase complex-like protein [Lecanora helva]
MIFSLFLFSLSILLWPTVQAESDYNEHLHLQPLTPASLLASFHFWSNASLRSYEQQHFKYIPRSLGQILQHAKTKELHLRFSTGRWDDDSWGTRPWGGTKEGGTGVELWAWVEADSEHASFARWVTLNNALSGLFCASLNFIDSTRTTKPRMTFEPTSEPPPGAQQSSYLLHGALPREVVCTENLTPFLKLLPCKGKAGIASLLDGHKLFDASWQSMSIDFRSVCSISGSDCSIEMEQTVDMVLDVERSKRPRDNPIPRPRPTEGLQCDLSKPYASSEACYPSDADSGQSWTVAEIFGRPIQGSCLAEDAQGNSRDSLTLAVPPERELYINSGIETKHESISSGPSRSIELPEASAFEMVLSHLGPQTFNNISQPPLYASRSFTGHGQERGGVQTLLTNPSTTSSVSCVYFENLPWFMKPYLHTLTARLSTSARPDPTLIKETFYRPALDRRRGTQLELLISVPPASTAVLTYDFDKAILRYTEYPPDANRGFDVAPAVIRLLGQPSDPRPAISHPPVYIRTNSLLLPLPTPDFSMPYNVIILTSTVMALAFGMIFNLLVRRFVGADEVEGYNFGAVRERIRGRVMLMRERILGKGKAKEE